MPQRLDATGGGGGTTQRCTLCEGRPAAARDGSCGQACSELLQLLGSPFAITNPSSKLVLEADAYSPGKIQVWRYNGQPNQLWQYDLSTRALVNLSSGQALDLDAADTTSVIAWNRNGRPNQQWTIDPNSQTITNPQTGHSVGVVGDRGELREGAQCVALPLTQHGRPSRDQVWMLQSPTASVAVVDDGHGRRAGRVRPGSVSGQSYGGGGGGAAVYSSQGVSLDGTQIVLTDNTGSVCVWKPAASRLRSATSRVRKD